MSSYKCSIAAFLYSWSQISKTFIISLRYHKALFSATLLVISSFRSCLKAHDNKIALDCADRLEVKASPQLLLEFYHRPGTATKKRSSCSELLPITLLISASVLKENTSTLTQLLGERSQSLPRGHILLDFTARDADSYTIWFTTWCRQHKDSTVCYLQKAKIKLHSPQSLSALWLSIHDVNTQHRSWQTTILENKSCHVQYCSDSC